MSTNKGIAYAGEVEITAIEIYSYRMEKLDIRPQMIEMSIYEDIFTNTIHGSLMVSDSFDLIETFPLVGEELIFIKMNTPSMGAKASIEYSGYIYKLSDRHQTSERGQVYTLHFTSYETIVDVNKKVSKEFSGKISDVVTKIVKDEVLLGSEKELVVESTENSIIFVSPYWNLLKTINWLSIRSLKVGNKSPTFVFYETLDNRLKFVSLDTLYTQQPKPGFHYKFDSFLRDTSGDGSTRSLDLEYNLIRDLYVDDVFDYLTRSESGMYSGKLTNTNLVSKTIKTTITDYVENFKNTSHLGKFPVNSNNLVRRPSAAMFNSITSEYAFDNQRDLKTQQWYLQRKALMGQAMSVYKVDITVSGRLDLRAGECVLIDVNKLQPVNRGDNKSEITSGYYSGKFMVGAIHHRFEGNNHTMTMQCFTESLSKELK